MDFIKPSVDRMQELVSKADVTIDEQMKLKKQAQNEIKRLQQICKHEWKVVNDPIGGYAVTTCMICGDVECG